MRLTRAWGFLLVSCFLVMSLWIAHLLLRDSPRLTIRTNTWFLGGIGFSPDGRALFSVAQGDRRVRLWDPMTGEARSTLVLHQTVMGMSLSSGGSYLAAFSLGAATHEVVVWPYAQGLEYQVFGDDARERVTCVALAPDGNLLASGLLDGGVRLWDIRSGTSRRAPFSHKGEVKDIVFSSCGQWLASVDDCGGTVMRWNIGSGSFGLVHSGDNPQVLATSPDAEILAVGEWDGTVSIIAIESEEVVCVLRGPGKGDYCFVHDLQFSPDGTVLVAGSAVDNGLRIWCTSSWQLLKFSKCHAVAVRSVAFSPDGHTLVTGGFRGEIKLWDINNLIRR